MKVYELHDGEEIVEYLLINNEKQESRFIDIMIWGYAVYSPVTGDDAKRKALNSIVDSI